VIANLPSIELADRTEHEAAVDLLAEAFADDPMIREAVSRASSPAIARRSIFDASTRTALAQGGALLVAKQESLIVGAAIVVGPDERRVRGAVQRVIAGLRFLRLLPLLGLRGLALLNDADLASRRLAPGAPHHVLVAVGVSSAGRGQGFGRALVDAAFARAIADPSSDGLRLETENPKNVELYARWGFDVLGRVEVDPVAVHVMYRSAREARKDA